MSSCSSFGLGKSASAAATKAAVATSVALTNGTTSKPPPKYKTVAGPDAKSRIRAAGAKSVASGRSFCCEAGTGTKPKVAVSEGSAGFVIVGPTPKTGPPLGVAAAVTVGIAMLTVVKVCTVVGTMNAGLAVVPDGPFVTVGATSDECPALADVSVRIDDGSMAVERLSCWLELSVEDVSGRMVGKGAEETVENWLPILTWLIEVLDAYPYLLKIKLGFDLPFKALETKVEKDTCEKEIGLPVCVEADTLVTKALKFDVVNVASAEACGSPMLKARTMNLANRAMRAKKNYCREIMNKEFDRRKLTHQDSIRSATIRYIRRLPYNQRSISMASVPENAV